MFRIAILGCENSHADAFLGLLKNGAYPDIECAGIFSSEPEASAKLNGKYGVPVMERFDSLAGQIDGVMITARHGDEHLKFARPYMKEGFPMFIDKPVTCTEADANTLRAVIERLSLRVCGGSSLALMDDTIALGEVVREKKVGNITGGTVYAPLHADSRYGGFFFYAQHLIDIMLTVFGADVQAVRCEARGERYSLLVRYPDYDVTAQYANSRYFAAVYGDKDVDARVLPFTSNAYAKELDEFHALLCGGSMKMTPERFVFPAFVMNAVWRAAKSGNWETPNV